MMPTETTRRQRNRKRRASVAMEGVRVEASRAVRENLRESDGDGDVHTALRAHERDLTELWHHYAPAVLTEPEPK